MRKNVFIMLLAFIILWGIALRAVEVINSNYLFGTDHGRDYLAAYNIVEHHKITLIGAEAGSGVAGINGIFHGPGYFYLISLAYALFHGDPMGGQLIMLLFGIMTMFAAAYVGYKILGRLGSVLFLFFVAVSPLVVSQSRFIWSSHPLTLFVIIALYFAYKIPEKPRIFTPLSLGFAGFTYHFQLGVAVPLVTSILLAMPIIYRIKDWKAYVYSIGTLLFIFFPMIYFDIRHGFMATNSAIAYVSQISSSSHLAFNTIKLSSHLFDYWNNFYNTFTFEFGWIPWKWQMLLLYASMPVVSLSLLWAKDLKIKKFIALLHLTCSVTWVAYFLLNNTVWDYYLTHTRIAFILLYTIAGVTIIFRLRHKATFIFQAIYVAFIVSVFVGSLFRMYVSYTIDIKDLGVYDKIMGKRFVIDTIYADSAGAPFNVFIFTPAIYTYPYDYLFKTYAKQHFGYEPGNQKHGLAYLIIEPDKSQPWRQKGWLETVVQGGNTIWIKTLLNGLILEKRQYPAAGESKGL